MLPALSTIPTPRPTSAGLPDSQVVISIPSNIAEGHARFYKPVYIQHLWTAHGSRAELETQLELGRRVEIVTLEEADALIGDALEVGRMLRGLVRSLERTP